MKRQSVITLFLLFLVLVCLVEPASAIAPKNNIAQGLLPQFKLAADNWIPFITARAQWLFWALATLDLTYMAIILILKNGDFYDFATNLVQKILFLGFFWAILIHGRGWMWAIVDSFTQIGSGVIGGSGGIDPASLLEHCFDTYMLAVGKLSVMKAHTWMMGVASIVLLVVGVCMAAIMIVTYLELYIGIAAGQIMLGFGGSMWTKDFAVSFIRYIVSIGLKLMVVNLISAMAVTLFVGWANIPPAQFVLKEVVALVMGLGLLLALMMMIPTMISGILSGGQFGSNPVSIIGSGLAMTAGVLAGGAGLAMGAAGGVAKSMAVLREATKASEGGGGIGSGIGSAIKNIAAAGARTVADNIGKPQMSKQSFLGGTYANLRAANQPPPPETTATVNSEGSDLNNLKQGD
ncbi:MAG: P-type conjugative transfer protein TrbL [Proteobacteria bacterium]|nr:P-type conjugative transfer protein TrbL [Pseudomonadota bacterium]MBU1586279.1 P-type conjugative transfer protein TrbL [Pseudomonadota bacterium]MBU2453175.1 P-type conjugative transfer protein TrbL [Pseudomonadota bacterium]MBU2630794.1 P-type conjugative transfer protein TrbL [Pseudomonadota bacterium]